MSVAQTALVPQQPRDPFQPYPSGQPHQSGQPYPWEQPSPYGPPQPYPPGPPTVSGPPAPHPPASYGPVSAVPAAYGPVSGVPGGGLPRRSRLGPGQRAALYVGGGTLAVLLLCGLGVTAVGALVGAGDPAPGTAVNAGRTGTPAAGASNAVAGAPAPTAPSATAPTATEPAVPTPSATPLAAPTPVVEKKTVTETRSVPFPKRTVKDSSLAKGKTKVRTRGVAGVKTLTYEVTLTDGVETARRLVRQQVTRDPVTEVVAVGTKETRRCDPNYSGCVPIASDVDCAGGSGNGPAYVRGPVRVIGKDIYGLDHDNDGYGCE